LRRLAAADDPPTKGVNLDRPLSFTSALRDASIVSGQVDFFTYGFSGSDRFASPASDDRHGMASTQANTRPL